MAATPAVFIAKYDGAPVKDAPGARPGSRLITTTAWALIPRLIQRAEVLERVVADISVGPIISVGARRAAVVVAGGGMRTEERSRKHFVTRDPGRGPKVPRAAPGWGLAVSDRELSLGTIHQPSIFLVLSSALLAARPVAPRRLVGCSGDVPRTPSGAAFALEKTARLPPPPLPLADILAAEARATGSPASIRLRVPRCANAKPAANDCRFASSPRQHHETFSLTPTRRIPNPLAHAA